MAPFIYFPLIGPASPKNQKKKKVTQTPAQRDGFTKDFDPDPDFKADDAATPTQGTSDEQPTAADLDL